MDGVWPDVPQRELKFASACEIISARLQVSINKEIEIDV